MELIILSFISAFVLSYFAIPPIIKIALEKNLCDEPGERSSHEERTPSLGGIAIFAGIIFSIVLWTPPAIFSLGEIQFIISAFIIVFLIGAKDDIAPVAPSKKIIAQVLAASILVLKSNIRFSSFYGLLGIYDGLPSWFYTLFSIFTVLALINAFNLIDGIDGLAGSIGALISGTLGIWFVLVWRPEYAILAFATCGAVIAFLRYNYTPAKIFMGDSGSLIIGMITAILAIKFIDLNETLALESPYHFDSIPVVAVGVMILPVFDTLRVFATRILRGQSPFKADRRHIHHLLIDYGFSHMQATGVLVFVNVFFIITVFALDKLMDQHLILVIILLVAGMLTYYLHRSVHRGKTLTEN